MKEQYTPFVIFSVFTKSNPLNNIHHSNTMSTLKLYNIPFTSLKGYYKGEVEDNIMVELPNDKSEKYLDVIRQLTKAYRQECYLYVDEDRNASLVFPEGRKERIGRFQEVDSVVGYDGYTVLNGKYYTCV